MISLRNKEQSQKEGEGREWKEVEEGKRETDGGKKGRRFRKENRAEIILLVLLILVGV